MARGSIQKRGTNYYIRYRLNGKQICKVVGPNKKTAERRLTDIMGQIHKGGYQEIKDINFAEFAEKWKADYAKPRVKPSTYEFYRHNIDKHIVPRFRDYNLSNITTHMIDEFLADKQREISKDVNTGRARQLSPTTVGYLALILKMIFKRAIIWEYLIKNPAEYVERPRAAKHEMDFLNIEELQCFLSSVETKDPAYYPLFLTAALTGMRRGELLGLKWGDVNWTNNQIHVRRSATADSLGKPKSSAGTRAIIVPPMLISVLRKHRLASPASEQDLMFPNASGTIIDGPHMVRRHFKPALRRAGLREVRFHDLRHTYASILISQGENLKFIQSQLGHSSAQITLDRYGHLMPQVQHGAGERLQDAVFGEKHVRSIAVSSSD